MITAPSSSVAQKRDLHVGGLGADASGALAAVTDRIPGLAQDWSRWARRAAREADDFVRANPWTALAVVAAAGLAAGYMLSQRPRGFSLDRLRKGALRR